MVNYIILHWSFWSCNGNRFPRLKDILEKNNHYVNVPQMPIWIGAQNFDNWSKILDWLNINKETIIIAHSIAPIFVCKYLITRKIKVRKLIFVCWFNNYFSGNIGYDTVNEAMYTKDFSNIKKYCDNIVCYYSDNDPYVDIKNEKYFAEIVANKCYIIKGWWHINAESGYNTFPDILKEI